MKLCGWLVLVILLMFEINLWQKEGKAWKTYFHPCWRLTFALKNLKVLWKISSYNYTAIFLPATANNPPVPDDGDMKEKHHETELMCKHDSFRFTFKQLPTSTYVFIHSFSSILENVGWVLASGGIIYSQLCKYYCLYFYGSLLYYKELVLAVAWILGFIKNGKSRVFP